MDISNILFQNVDYIFAIERAMAVLSRYSYL